MDEEDGRILRVEPVGLCYLEQRAVDSVGDAHDAQYARRQAAALSRSRRDQGLRASARRHQRE